jgi:NAD+ synthase (glutamine-hydrolysing)
MSTHHSKLITVATCQLNQWALDFEGNLERIYESCCTAKSKGATYRLGPELEICGYGVEDHFYEGDTIVHCWESLVTLLQRGCSDDLLCDFGMPVLFQGCRYNCRILCFNRQILLIRPKSSMADNGNYRESRYFTAYTPTSHSQHQNQNFLLPTLVYETLGQRDCSFGIGFVQSSDGIRVGCESCEELWTPRAAHIDLALQGVEIVGNGSGSHHELRKLETRMNLIVGATQKCGGIYLYANQRGCDGSRLYFDGCSMIVVNGHVVAQAPQFAVQDVTVLTATIDVNDVTSYRASIPSLGVQVASSPLAPVFQVTSRELRLVTPQSRVTPLVDKIHYHTPEEECCLGPACWLWDYLRRSGASGFLLPLSGGADSSSVATIVAIMCRLVFEAAPHDGQVAKDVQRICGDMPSDWLPDTPQVLADYVLHTVYMGTENSSTATESRALRLAQAIGAYHNALKIDVMVASILSVFTLVTGKTPQFSSRGGTMTQDLALQNIQARLRMVTAYLFAQLLPWVRGRTGFLLVLGSANVDEGLRGYMTKYDCSSADLNPIGAISKVDLKRMLLHCAQYYPVLDEIAGAPPTAELRPLESGENEEHSQLDEEEMGMTYEELGWFGRLRKLSRCGPVSMYSKLVTVWSHLKPSIVAEKVQRFFFYYAINRHKMCTITPSYHAEAYSPDDNRFDLRQFLYNPKWERQFSVMNKLAEQDEVNFTEQEEE